MIENDNEKTEIQNARKMKNLRKNTSSSTQKKTNYSKQIFVEKMRVYLLCNLNDCYTKK